MGKKKSSDGVMTMDTVERSKRKATVYDIAKLAGVSPITVSRAFNKRIPVSDITKEKIFEASEILNYKPNPLAKGLKGGDTHSLSLLWSVTYPMIPSDVFYNLVTDSKKKGYYFQLIGVMGTNQDVYRALEESRIRGVDGVSICITENIDDATVSLLKQFKAATVITGEPLPYEIDQIVWDRTVAICEIVKHFKTIGRKRIGYIADSSGNRNKIQAFLDAAINYGFLIGEGTFVDMPVYNKSEDIEKFLSDYLNSGKFNLDAVICLNDEYAASLIYLLQKRGMRVPEDVAVVGFNNTLMSSIIKPGIATVERCHEKIGEAIDRLIFNRLENPNLTTQKTKVNMQFVLRDSADIVNKS